MASHIIDVFQAGDLKSIQRTLGEVNEPVYKDGKCPLHLAALYGHEDIAAWLLGEGADVDALDQGSHTPLHLAAKYGHTNLIQLLVNQGAEVNAANKMYKLTPLHMAVKENQQRAMQLLIQFGADVEVYDKDGVQPLHIAAEKGHRQLIVDLVKAGARPDCKDQTGWTPLHLAIQSRHDHTVALLLKLNADPDTANKEGKTPIDIAAEQQHAAIVPLLNSSTAAQLACPELLHIGESLPGAVEPSSSLPANPAGPSNSDGLGSGSDSLLGSLGLMDSLDAACPFCSLINDIPPSSHSAGGGSSLLAQGVPSLFICPLSDRVLTDPVVACDGFTYDRRAIQEFFETGQRISPLTKQPLRSSATLPNHVNRLVRELGGASKHCAAVTADQQQGPCELPVTMLRRLAPALIQQLNAVVAAPAASAAIPCWFSAAAAAAIKRLYVGNLLFEATAEDLGKHFSNFGDVKDVIIPLDGRGRSRGYAFVEMDEAGANAAITGLDQKEFMGRTLFISEARPREEGLDNRGFRRDRQQRQQPYRRQDRQNDDGW
eukprot:gene12828-12956_t